MADLVLSGNTGSAVFNVAVVADPFGVRLFFIIPPTNALAVNQFCPVIYA